MMIHLKCLFMTDEIKQAADLTDKQTPLTEYVERTVTFYKIDALCPHFEKGIEYTSIITGGFETVSRLKAPEIESIIERWYTDRN